MEMKKIIIPILILLCLMTTKVSALSNSFQFDPRDLSYSKISKKNSVTSNFNKDYALTYSLSNENEKLEEEIKNLTKKTTYLLFGDFNETKESSEHYYKRHKDWLDLRYNPKVPKDDTNPLGLDTSSKEYQDDVVSGLAIPQIFKQVNEKGMIYSSYGDIRVTIHDDLIISSITLPNVKSKEQSKEDPMKYEYRTTNYVMYYYYKKLGNEWKLYYLYGDSTENINDYFKEVSKKEADGTMAIAPSYESQLGTIYSFQKLEEMSEEELEKIVEQNKKNIVYLNSYYNNKEVTSANGFYISPGLVVTTWNFLEKSLMDAQHITATDSEQNPLEIEGIVTAKKETDVALIKLKENTSSSVTLGDSNKVEVEDPVITISSKTSSSASVQTGILISKEDYLQTSIPLLEKDEGSPLFNKEGEVIGINTSLSTQASISIAMNSDVLKEIKEKVSKEDFDKIESISFKELKEKYYYKTKQEEKVVDTIPKSKWKKYSKIGKIEKTIPLELVKASYQDGVVSLRYKNEIGNFMSSMQLSTTFREELKKEGYQEIVTTEEKAIYESKKYKVIVMDEFDYLIVVMVKL